MAPDNESYYWQGLREDDLPCHICNKPRWGCECGPEGDYVGIGRNGPTAGHTQPESAPAKWEGPQGHKADCGFVYGKACTCGWSAFCKRPIRRSPDRTFALDVKGELEFAAQCPPEAAPLPDAPGSAEAFYTSSDWHIEVEATPNRKTTMKRVMFKFAESYAEAYATSRDQRVRELEAKVKESAQAWLHENSAKNVLIEENARLRERLAKECAKTTPRCGYPIRRKNGEVLYGCCRAPNHDGAHETLEDRHSGKYKDEVAKTIESSLTDWENLRPDGTRHKEER